MRTTKEDLTVRPDGLQLEEDRRFQERFWIAERCAWVAYLLILLAALGGLTGGGGPLSRGGLSFPGGGTIDYARIARWEASDELTVTFPPGDAERALTLSRRFSEHFQIADVQPTPERVEGGPEGQRLIFRLPSNGPARVTIHVRPTTPGFVRFQATLGGGGAAQVSTLILP